MKVKYYIEPRDVVTNESELFNELIMWAEAEDKKLEILTTGESVFVDVDGEKLRVKLEPPRNIYFKSRFPTRGAMLGFKWIYLYEDK